MVKKPQVVHGWLAILEDDQTYAAARFPTVELALLSVNRSVMGTVGSEAIVADVDHANTVVFPLVGETSRQSYGQLIHLDAVPVFNYATRKMWG